MKDAYETVAKAIRFVRARVDEQPTLTDVAAHVGMSEFHLQRTFTAWAGISPKRFLQVLTAERARALLSSSRDVLDAAVSAGLSGPGRLHDLTVACFAMTPGEIAKGADVRFGFADSPYGRVIVGRTDRGVCHLQFVDHSVASASAALASAWPQARRVRDDAAAREIVDDMFAHTRARRAVPVVLRGTNFQVQVWRALVSVPAGQVVSYGALAHAVGKPSAARAVGAAVGANSVALLIPCHRVIREDGGLGGYRWGTGRKDVILAREQMHIGAS
jgi:AraC family transcriptional regulator of adaptative response/methylated-DNA-[protein]-cysteine methyltransferase